MALFENGGEFFDFLNDLMSADFVFLVSDLPGVLIFLRVAQFS
jgi:hypothetical protein